MRVLYVFFFFTAFDVTMPACRGLTGTHAARLDGSAQLASLAPLAPPPRPPAATRHPPPPAEGARQPPSESFFFGVAF